MQKYNVFQTCVRTIWDRGGAVLDLAVERLTGGGVITVML